MPERLGDVNESERRVYDALRRDGYSVYRHGWPDFLAIRDNKAKFVEVKGALKKLGGAQIRMHEALRSVGLDVEVISSPIKNPGVKGRFTFTISPDLLICLDDIAGLEHRSRSAMIEMILRKSLEAK